MDCHTVVVGLGAVGSALVYQLTRRGCDVVGIDQYRPPHDHGSSHGETRITRLAMGEGAPYTKLAKRSYEIWQQIEREASIQLLTSTGGLLIGPDDGDPESYVRQTIAAAVHGDIAHEVFNSREIKRCFPLFEVDDGDFAYFEPMAGLLRPERCVEAQLSLARFHGARLRLDERVIAVDETAHGVRLTTDRGVLTAAKAVFAAGPWLSTFLDRDLAQWFKVYRQVQFWFTPSEEKQEIAQLPVFIWELRGSKKGIYGTPGIDGGVGSVKIASEQYETLTSAEQFDAIVSREEIDAMRVHFVRPFLPALDGRCIRTAACMYTVTPDSDFVIDYHPTNRNLIIASPCSGHGFKHSAAVGEAIAELILTDTSAIDLTPFQIQRFRS